MLKHILLLSPVYVTIFWSIVLNTNNKHQNTPRRFLGKFMLFAFVVYGSHLLYFAPLHDLYFFADPLYQYASLLVYPMYYIYFRMLSVDEKFSWRLHARYLVLPTLLFLLYTASLLFTTTGDYKSFLFDSQFHSTSLGIKYLLVIKKIIRFSFLVQVIAAIIGSTLLIKKHGAKAQQYYSDMEDSSTYNIKVINTLMIITGCASLVLGALGRQFFSNGITGLAISSVIFTSMLFVIGWLGNKQKLLNPSSGLVSDDSYEDLSQDVQSEILQKILHLFETKKFHLQTKVNIMEVAQEVGTNRTYISSIINQKFNQNFCSFVNNYRVDELEKAIKANPKFNNQLLAESCGFGSTDSLKRAVIAKTGKSLPEWRNEILQKRQ